MEASVIEKQGIDRINALFKVQKTSLTGLRKELISNRKERLNSLRTWIKANRVVIQQTIYNDFRKPAAEVDTTEIFPALDEIKVALDNLDSWAAPKKVDAPITMLGTR